MSHLTKTDQVKIDGEVIKVLLQTNKSYPEDKLLDIVKGLGIEVYMYDFGEYSDKVSGAIKPGKDSIPTRIYLNKKYSPERLTFTLAHELGHYLLHRTDDMKLRIDKFDYATNTVGAKQETEANYFAAALLMPKDRFLDVLKQTNSFTSVAKYFGVSESAARNRLRWIQMNQM